MCILLGEFCEWLRMLFVAVSADGDTRVPYFRVFAQLLFFPPPRLIEKILAKSLSGRDPLLWYCPFLMSCPVWITHVGGSCGSHTVLTALISLCSMWCYRPCEPASISVHWAQPNVGLLIRTNLCVLLCTVRYWVYVTTTYQLPSLSGIKMITMNVW